MSETMSAHSVLRDLDSLIASRSILEHPFYRAWTAGTLTADQLATYARSYYPHVAAFPCYLETAVAGTDDDQIRAELLDNLREEREVPQSHPAMWLDFAAGFGLDRDEVASAAPTASTRETVEAFQGLAAEGTAEALTALYCYESQQPEVAHTKAEGLRNLYGVQEAGTVAYFDVHAEADVRHREGERQALARCLNAGATREQVLGAAEKALDAYWNLLDGICEETGIPLAC